MTFPRPTLLLAALFTSAFAYPGRAQEHRYVFAERHALAFDTSRIAVFAGMRSRAEVEAPIAAQGLAAEGLESGPIRGWWIARTPEQDRTHERVRALLGRLALDPRIEFVSPVFEDADHGPLIPLRELFVRFYPGLGAGEMRAVIAAHPGLSIVEERWAGLDGAWRLASSAREGLRVLHAANALAIEPGVVFAEVDFLYTGRGSHVPNDPLFASCWGLDNTGQGAGWVPDVDMDVVEAWDLSIGDPAIVVGVLDVGVQFNHPDLHLAPGTDVTPDASANGSPFGPCDNHGTLVAGCIAGVIDNALGAVGSAPNCRVASVRALQALPQCNNNWTTTTGWIVAALTWMEQNGVRVTNCSNGLMAAASVTSKYQALHDAGIVHFASAGNSGLTTMHYPSTLPTVNGLSAIAPDGTLASWSNHGPGLDFTAPGVGIWTTDRTGSAGFVQGNYYSASGTSMSAPYAAGVAALMLSQNPTLTADDVDQLLRLACDDWGAQGYDDLFGYGLVNARRALELAGTPCPAPQNTCTANPNSTGGPASINFSGSNSVAANDLVLLATGCPAQVGGRFLLSTGSAQAPFGDGFLCLAAPLQRLPVTTTNASGDTAYALDLANLPGGAVIQSGDTRWFQFLYRDPFSPTATFNTSDGLMVTFCP